jgi:hypothetical protein
MLLSPKSSDSNSSSNNPTFSNSVVLDLRTLSRKKFLPFSQKAVILKVISLIETSDNGIITGKSLEDAKECLNILRDGQVNIYLNTGVVSALFGISTFAMLLTPLQPSTINLPNDYDNIKGIEYGYTVCAGLSTAFSFVAIFLSTFYALIITQLLTDNEDLLWFLVHIPSTLIVNLFCIFGIIALLFAILIGLYLVYSYKVATVTLAFMFIVLALYLVFGGMAAYPVFKRIQNKYSKVQFKEE